MTQATSGNFRPLNSKQRAQKKRDAEIADLITNSEDDNITLDRI